MFSSLLGDCGSSVIISTSIISGFIVRIIAAVFSIMLVIIAGSALPCVRLIAESAVEAAMQSVGLAVLSLLVRYRYIASTEAAAAILSVYDSIGVVVPIPSVASIIAVTAYRMMANENL